MSEKLGCLEWWWLGVFIALNHLIAIGEAVCRWAHRTVRCASHVTQPLGFWRFWLLERWLHVTSDSPVLHQIGTVHCLVRLWRLLWLLRALFTLLQTTVALLVVAPLGAPDSPVNYSGAAPEKPEGEEFRLYGPWCTGHCPVAHRTVRCARPGLSSVSFAPFFWTLTWSFYWFVLNLYAPVEYII
jgi:hypothetical protein